MKYTDDIENIKKEFNMMLKSAETTKLWREDVPVITQADCTKIFSKLGITWGNPYHANGIGNNNLYTLKRIATTPDGYKTELIVGEWSYNYGLYNNEVYISIYDNDGNRIWYPGDKAVSKK